MNSNDPLFKNYMALYLSIVSNNSVTQSLMAIGLLGYRKDKKTKELTWEDLDKEDKKLLEAQDDNENSF